MVTLEELLAAIKALDFTQIASDPRQIAVVAIMVLLLILLAVWSRRRRSTDEPAPKVNASSPALGQNRGPTVSREAESAQKLVSASATSYAPAQSGADVQPVPVRQQASEIPQDSVLHRHYLANEAAKDTALHEPYPSDSVLRRHYDTAHKIAVETNSKSSGPIVIDNSAVVEIATANEAPTVSEQVRKTSSIEQAVNKTVKVEPVRAEKAALCGKVSVPEDSVLKRHFIAQLRAEIEAGLSPRPADSVLRRHHDSLVGFELTKRLVG